MSYPTMQSIESYLTTRLSLTSQQERDAIRQALSDARGVGVREGMKREAELASDPNRGCPYPTFCATPDRCRGLSNCPRDPCCAD